MLGLLLLLVSACTYVGSVRGNVPIDAEIPYAPLFEPLPLRVGVCYTQGLRDYVALLDEGKARFEVGQASLRIFDRALNAMFEEVQGVSCSATDQKGNGALDGIVEVELSGHSVNLGWGIWLGNARFDLHYRFKLYAADGTLVSSTTKSGKGRWVYMGEPPIVAGKMARDAIRDAASQFMRSFVGTPEIERWLASMKTPTPGKSYAMAPPTGDGVVVVILPDLALFQTRAGATPYGSSEKDYGFWFEHCVQSEMRSIRPSLRILPHDEVRNIFFPWYERSVAPRHKGIAKLLAKPMVRSRLSQHGVRFAVSMRVLTSLGEVEGGILESTEAFGLGHRYRSRKTEISAVVWDAQVLEEPGELIGVAEGTSALTSIVIPIPTSVARTEQEACEDISRQLVDYVEQQLRGGSSSGAIGDQ